jgi:hypothetical protein
MNVHISYYAMRNIDVIQIGVHFYSLLHQNLILWLAKIIRKNNINIIELNVLALNSAPKTVESTYQKQF